MKTVILGGGIAGLSLAYFLDGRSVILEKEEQLGGLSRSFTLNGIAYDIGPHIMFSKNKEILRLHTSLVETVTLRRSNRIWYQGRFVKYPFENELSALDPAEREYCVRTFLENPYAGYAPENMLQFFLQTFGEGITNLYLRPYNEKIWKFDPAFLDTQMVERIPKPPKQDILDSAAGKATEGYAHQLYFRYPKQGGYQKLVDGYVAQIRHKTEIVHPVSITGIEGRTDRWIVRTDRGNWEGERLVNCMPLHELFPLLDPPPADVAAALQALRYNSLTIVVAQVARDALGEHFAIYVPDPKVIFHRVSKLNALGPAYCLPDGGSTLLAEVTHRPGSDLARLSPAEMRERVLDGLERAGFARRADVLDTAVRSFQYEYVIYDLHHRQNADRVLDYLRGIGIRCVGRFAEFQYVNSDQVAARAQQLAQELMAEPVSARARVEARS